MNFLKMYYDRVIALAALVFVVIALFFLIFQIKAIRKGLEKDTIIPNEPDIKAFEFEPVDQLKVSLENPNGWQSNNHRLFQSRLLKVGEGGYPELAVSAQQKPVNPQGIPIDWLKRYDLDIKDPNIGSEDADGDGYTNLEEYEGESNPIDSTSIPSPANKLRVKARYLKDFPYQFLGYSESVPGVFIIQLNDGNGKTVLIREGKEFGDGNKLIKLNRKTEKRFNPRLSKEVEEDASTVTIVDKNGQPVILEKGRKGKTNETFALLVYLRDGKEYEVREGDKLLLEKIKFTVDKIVPADEKNEIDVGVGLVVVSSVKDGVRTTYELKSFNPKEDKKAEQPGNAEAGRNKPGRQPPVMPAMPPPPVRR